MFRVLFITSFFLQISLFGIEKREFRGAWIATVHNIDWPSRKGLSSWKQKRELIEILDFSKKIGLNALIFQVRSSCDAMYKSNLEPWSPFLSGTMGKNPGYDPLAFIIKESHKRGIEIHAWFNPFRALANRFLKVSSDHITKQKPALCVAWDNQIWLNPSANESYTMALKVIKDVLTRYDIDGIHIDDYFYPYPVYPEKWTINDFPDKILYEEYKKKGGRKEKGDWRRNNINRFVYNMYKMVKEKKPWVRVGISPFGIWRPKNPKTVSASLDAFRQIHADSRLWLEKGLCDYMAPQLYWRIHPEKHSFKSLLKWWNSRNKRNKYLWPGIATNRIMSKKDPGRSSDEIINQIKLSRKFGNGGHIHFSMKSLMQNRDGIVEKLKDLYKNSALVPPKK